MSNLHFVNDVLPIAVMARLTLADERARAAESEIEQSANQLY